MLETVSSVLSIILTYIIDCLIFKKIIHSKIKIFTLRNILLILVMSLISSFIDANYTDALKMIVCNIQSCILLKMIFNESFIHTIVFTIILFLASTVAEIFFALIFVFGLHIDANFFTESTIGMCLGNMTISVIYYFIFCIKPIYKFTEWIVKFYNNSLKIEIPILLIFIIILTASITYPIVVHSYSVRETITFILILVATLYFIVNLFWQRSKNGELKKEYDSLLGYMSEYEKALDEKSKNQHEYKNQLIMIKNMVTAKNKKAEHYIQNLLNEKESKNIELLNDLKSLPTGGIKGLIYYKAEKMLEVGIEVHINVDKILEKKKLWYTCEQELKDVSRIVGVYLDNAIEAANKADKKYIVIDVEYDKDKIIFSFSNTYKEHIELDKIDKEGYSTKGKNRGYGLSLVQEILKKNQCLFQNREMNGMFYVQRLVIQGK